MKITIQLHLMSKMENTWSFPSIPAVFMLLCQGPETDCESDYMLWDRKNFKGQAEYLANMSQLSYHLN